MTEWVSNKEGAGSEMKKPHFKDRVCDNVLPGQGYRTPQGAMRDM
jgi:hypothetical protein